MAKLWNGWKRSVTSSIGGDLHIIPPPWLWLYSCAE